MDWLLWLLLGLILGWLIELFIDYLYWRRKCEESASEANSRSAALQAQLNSANATNKALEAQVTELKTNDSLPATLPGLGLLARSDGLLAALGEALSNGDETALSTQVREIDTKLARSANLESELNLVQEQLSAAQSELTSIRVDHETNAEKDDELEYLRNKVVGLQEQKTALTTKLNKSEQDISLLANADGLLGTLGKAISNSDKQTISSQLADIGAQLSRAPKLESDLNDIQGELNAAQSKLDHLQRELEVKSGFEAEVENLRSQLNTVKAELESLRVSAEARAAAPRSIGRLSSASGLIGALGSALAADNDEQVEARIRALDIELEAKSKLETEVNELRRRLSETSNSN
ncbi:hypothetical protein KFU94_15575 [Chloroflexi bacterium TSY]|nr:hypothetical protein [Chloroflexi bacterium TSY]